MDHATTGAQSIAESGIVHLHVLHGDDLFSKSQYEAGNYSQLDIAGTATSTSFWPIFPRVSQLQSTPHAPCATLLSTHAGGALIGARDPMLSPIGASGLDLDSPAGYSLVMAVQASRLPDAELSKMMLGERLDLTPYNRAS